MISVGIIDTVGFVGSVNALDTCLKTADVEFVRFEKMSGGIVSIVIKGDVAAVSASIAAGVEAAKSVGEYRKHTIIARLDDQTQEMLDKSGHADPELGLKSEADLPVEILIAEKNSEKKLAHTEESLNDMTVSNLRKLAREMNLKHLNKERIKRSRKSVLIENILEELKEEEE